MDNESFKIEVSDESVTARTKSRRRHNGPRVFVAVCALLLLACAAAYLLFPGEPEQQSPNDSQTVVEQNNQARPENSPELPTQVTSTAVPDDGTSLWESPASGKPIDCSYLLPGTQMLLHVRVADLLAHPESEKVQAALGPWGDQAIQQLTALTGAPIESIDSLTLGIRQARSGNLEYSLRLQLVQSLATSDLGSGSFSPEGSNGEVLVWCSPAALTELKNENGEPPIFARELARVVQRTDQSRTASLVFAGKFLQISGEKFLLGSGEVLRTAIVDFLGDEATATAVSADWNDHLFLELVSTVTLNERPHRFAATLQKRVAQASDQIENSILATPPHPHGRKVLARFPAMLRKLSNYTRVGEEDKLSLMRCYLPITAGHNLLMAAELLLNLPTDGQDTLVANNTEKPTESPRSLTARLQQTTSLVFPKETLQRALEMLSEDVGVPIQIAGRDLQLEGITKNQSFAIDLRNRPAKEILLAVLLRANPDRTATGAADIKQKLVYVVREREGAIVVTTRTAAEKRSEKLPAVFEPASR